jgi:FkbM family methyltransferase
MGILSQIRKNLFASEMEKTVAKWHESDGDNTLRLSYDNLDENSIVLDLGGYKGEWTSHIFSKYLCTVYVFEPVSDFNRQINDRFRKNQKIKVFPFGLGKKNQEETIYLQSAATSVFKKRGKPEIIAIRKYDEFLKENKISKIDLLKINIEGSEYDLLEFIIENKLAEQITDIQVQFHSFVKDAFVRMKKIQSKLSETHSLTYQYPFVWENWRLNR